MAKYATGKRSQAISDRSGQAFPYNEMVKEWNGSLVHISEFEPKQPQIQRRYNTADAIALQNPRPQKLLDTDVNLDANQFISFDVDSQVPQEDGSVQNKRRQMNMSVGDVTVSVS